MSSRLRLRFLDGSTSCVDPKVVSVEWVSSTDHIAAAILLDGDGEFSVIDRDSPSVGRYQKAFPSAKFATRTVQYNPKET